MVTNNKPLTVGGIPLNQSVVPASLIDNYSGKEYKFPFNINDMLINYQMNQQSYDTIGGRVVQLLSVRINTLQVDGDAGSRSNLINLYNNFRAIQDNQNLYKMSTTFLVPSRNLKFQVFLEQMNMSWDIGTVTYPYQMLFEVEQDVSATTTDQVTTAALDLLQGGIGFVTNNMQQWTGLSTSDQNIQYSSLFMQGLQSAGL